MTIILGTTLTDHQTLPPAPANVAGRALLPPAALLRYLEGFYALGAPTVNRAALRTEQYRQLLTAHLGEAEANAEARPFYAASFTADQPATAADLLSRRDELLAAGYSLRNDPESATPARIVALHQLEALLHDDRYDFRLLPGEADRLLLLLSALNEDRHPRLNILLNEPRHLLPPGYQRLLSALEKLGDTVNPLPEPEYPISNTDLATWQKTLLAATPVTPPTTAVAERLLQSNPGQAKRSPGSTPQLDIFSLPEEQAGTGVLPPELTADGTLVILKAERETHIAAYLARLLRDNADWRPGLLLPLRNQTLDNALLAEGLPSLGVPSTSLARPSLQVLKLITTFLWDPIEIDKVMEFVSLVTKPLHWRLGQRIAVFLADTPGMFGPRWYGTINGFFNDMKTERGWNEARVKTVRDQYDTWFERNRYPRQEAVPKNNLRQLLNSLREWALEEYTESRKPRQPTTDNRQRTPDNGQPTTENTGLLILAAQAQRAMELLDAQPETELSYLDVERLVKMVYEPAPTQFQHRESGALSTIFAPASALKLPDGEALQQLIWWDFIEHEPDYFFSRYYPEELAYLTGKGIVLNGPDQRNELAAWAQLRPVLQTQQRLMLCLPERVDGSPVEAHPLLGDLEAAFPDGALDRITINVDAAGEATALLNGKTAPAFSPVPVRPLAGPVAQLHLGHKDAITERDPETPTALEDLLYYPHKWVFRHQLRLKSSPILSIAAENRLRGNLSHLFIEQLLNQIKEDKRAYTREDVRAWIDDNWMRLLRNEGAVMLEYGQEPERVQFVRTMHYAAWSLVHYLQENGWGIRGSEEVLTGELTPMGGQPVKGRADLVLERNRGGNSEVAIVDLKWRGKTVFRNLLRNAKDVQLCLYAEFVSQDKARPAGTVHTAYYVIRDATMIARNELAFANIETVSGPEDAKVVQRETLGKVRATYNWRWEQFREGVVEIRCKDTLGELEDLYLGLDHDSLLEPGDDDARFDDYRSLIGLVR